MRATCRSTTTCGSSRATHTIVVDTGFDAAAAAARGRTLVRPVAEGLAAIGVDPATVPDVVITHMHYDHAGNTRSVPARAFPRAGRRDGFLHGPRHDAPPFVRSVRRENVVTTMVRRVFDGRVVFHAGDADPVSGRDAASSARPHAGTAGGARGNGPRARGPRFRRRALLGESGAGIAVPDRRRRAGVSRVAAGAAPTRRPRPITSFLATTRRFWRGFPAEPGVADVVRLDLCRVAGARAMRELGFVGLGRMGGADGAAPARGGSSGHGLRRQCGGLRCARRAGCAHRNRARGPSPMLRRSCF